MQKRKEPLLKSRSVKSLNDLSDWEKSKKVFIKKLARGELPTRAVNALKESILGAEYALELILVGDARSRFLNATYRGTNKPTNILSFPLAKQEGQLVLHSTLSEKEARQQKVAPRDYQLYLLTHGMLHLRGLDHGKKMEQLEVQWLKSHVSHLFLAWLKSK